MRPSVRRSITANIFLTAWGLVTLVLFFMVILLAYEMINNGQRPLSSLKTPEAATPNTQQEAVFRPTTIVGERDVLLYFAAPEANALLPLKVKMEYSDSAVENCRRALELMIKGPQQAGYTPVLPATTSIRAIYLLENGELVVDFGQELTLEHAQFKSVSIETLLLYGVVNTLTQEALHTPTDPPVRRVRLLFDGETPQETFPAHINVSEPLLPNMDWVGKSSGWSING